MRLRAVQNYSSDWIDLYGWDNGVVATTLTMTAHPDGAYSEPFTRLNRADAQELIDSLWNAGLRPTQGRQSEGVTTAQAAHLTDMRAIAFAKLNITLPGG